MPEPQAIEDYVLFHFRSLYNCNGITINYGAKAGGKIHIKSSDTRFFSQSAAHPSEIWWKKYKGVKLPFFFQPPAENLIMQSHDGSVTMTADILKSAFYLLSGWQEYYSKERDNFGRFPYRESIQYKLGIVTLPVVNYYFSILLDAIELATGERPTRKLWPEYTFVTCLTHDIDRCESGWKIAGLAALKKGNFLETLSLLKDKALGTDSWFNVRQIASLEEKYLARGTYFFLPEKSKYNGLLNADYDVQNPRYKKLLSELQKRQHEVAVHGSFGTSENLQQLDEEIKRLTPPIKGNRFHFLKYDPANTPELIQEAGLQYDSMLGFAEHYGFRNSFCHPFRPWDFKNNRMCSFTELPLNLMDVTLRHPNYMMLKPSDILPALKPMLKEIANFNGCFTLLWHNENFTGYQFPQDRKIFKNLVKLCQAKGSLFMTCSQVAEQVSCANHP